jgi:hypothetical protein
VCQVPGSTRNAAPQVSDSPFYRKGCQEKNLTDGWKPRETSSNSRARATLATALWPRSLLINPEFLSSFDQGLQIVGSRVVNLSAAGQDVSPVLPAGLY